MRTFKNKKGAAIWQYLIPGIIGMVIVFVVLGFGTGFFKKMFSEAKKIGIDPLEDCDLDGRRNLNDDCPCLPFGAVESELNKGCPKGLSSPEIMEDKRTCKLFVSEKEPGAFKPKCDAEEKANCITRCEQVAGETIELPKGTTGLQGKWDLMITELEVYVKGEKIDSSKGRHDASLNGAEELAISLAVKIKNNGEEPILNDFKTGVFVCNNQKANCRPAFPEGSQAWSTGGLSAGAEESLPKKEFKIGVEGDACDGEKDTNCYLKVMVDPVNDYPPLKGVLGETNEDNNARYFYLVLKGQKFEEALFEKHNSIEIVCNDEGNPDPAKKQIKGFGGSCGDRKPQESRGCLIVGTEEDLTTNDCALGAAKSGFVLSHTMFDNLDLIVPAVNEEGDDADNCFKWQWKSLPGGSLLCKGTEWYQCNPDTEGQLLLIEGKRFTCEGGHWKQR